MSDCSAQPSWSVRGPGAPGYASASSSCEISNWTPATASFTVASSFIEWLSLRRLSRVNTDAGGAGTIARPFCWLSDDEDTARRREATGSARPATAGIGRYVEVALPIGERDCRAARGHATGVDDAV